VILERLDRLSRHRVHRSRADQLLNVQDVPILGVLRRCRRPQAPLGRRAFLDESIPAVTREDLLVVLVGELRVRDGELSLEVCVPDLVEPAVGFRVHA
jgi:hypothetical protein